MSEDTQNNDADADWGAAMQEQGESDVGTQADKAQEQAQAQAQEQVQAQAQAVVEEDYERAEFKDLSGNSNQLTNTIETNLDVILDIPVTLSMEIGRTELPINSLLQLNQGSVVELDRLAGEPMDVLINGTLIAHGEVVVINEKFGIRLTDVISPAERVKKLK